MKQRYLARVELFKHGKPFRLDPKTARQVPTVVNGPSDQFNNSSHVLQPCRRDEKGWQSIDALC